MSLPFDATLKDRVQNYLEDYETQMGLRGLGPFTPLNVDLSTITAATDIALGHGDPPDRIVDVNFQSGPAEELPGRVLLYNALLHYRYRVAVHTLVVLLRPLADRRQLTGKLRYVGRPRKGKMEFSYEIIRLWRQPVRRYLAGGLGTLPLAPLCRLPAAVSVEAALAPVIRRVLERLEREATPDDRAKLAAATYVLAGLRVPPEVADRLFEGVRTMKESSTYQAILAEGRIEALKKTLLRLGRERFRTSPSEKVQTAIQAINDEGRLERMTERLLSVSNWRELLETE